MEKLNPYQSGARAAHNGTSVNANPYPDWTSDGRAWLVGWREVSAFRTAIDALGPNHWLRAGE